MMRSRKQSLALIAGTLGLAFTIPNFLPPLAESLLLGSSVGMIIVSPLAELVDSATARSAKDPTRKEKLEQMIKERSERKEAEYGKVLDSFDSLLVSFDDMQNPKVYKQISKRFKSSVAKLTAYYPVWDPEGRMRTYVLMRKIGRYLNLQNADPYLDIAYGTLVERGDEAVQLSHATLNGKVERMYRQPWSENAPHLAGTLLLMNRGDDLYAQSMVVDAIHLWSERRFSKLEEDFAAVCILGPDREDSILEMLDREAEKARRAGNGVAMQRAQRLKATILSASTAPAH